MTETRTSNTMINAEEFYRKVLLILKKNKIQFLIGGTYAVMKYTGIKRPTKDLDIFCRAGNYPKIIKLFHDLGFDTEVNDERWLAKIVYKNYYTDIIFNSTVGYAPVDETWFRKATKSLLFGVPVRLMPIEELIWGKAFRMGRKRFDGSDINHLILKKGKEINWRHLLNRMEATWEILFAHISLFRFVYPSERNIVPKWLMEELISRLKQQLSIPPPKDKITRGSLLSLKQYNIDITKWGFLDLTQL